MRRLTLDESRAIAARVWGPPRTLAEDAIRALRVGVAEDVVGTGLTPAELARLAAEIKALKAQDAAIAPPGPGASPAYDIATARQQAQEEGRP